MYEPRSYRFPARLMNGRFNQLAPDRRLTGQSNIAATEPTAAFGRIGRGLLHLKSSAKQTEDKGWARTATRPSGACSLDEQHLEI